MRQEAQLQITAILQRLGLTPEQRARVQNEFVGGRDYIDAEYRIRLSAGWSGLPLKSLVVGHQDPSVRIRGLVTCLMIFESFTDVQLAQCCHFTLTLLGRGSVVREQIICCVRRTHEIQDLPALHRIHIAAQHTPVCEQSIERKHAQAHAATRASPNHTVQFDSIKGLRKAEVMNRFEDSPEEVKKLAGVFESDARSPLHCLESLDLLAHPHASNYLKEGGQGFSFVPQNVASDIIYRNNDYDQTFKFPPFQRPPPPDLGSLGLAIDAAIGPRSGMDIDGVSNCCSKNI